MTDLPETISVKEQAEAAGKGKILPIGAYPDIDELRDHIQSFLRQERPRHDQALAVARTKADELIYWLRANRG
jgi:hypothetical protein